jgi:hypothetical protein
VGVEHNFLEKMGGFSGPAGRPAFTVDASALPAEESDELRRLVREADPAAHAPGAAAAARPDAFRYRLVIDVDGREHTIEVGDSDMPARCVR